MRHAPRGTLETLSRFSILSRLKEPEKLEHLLEDARL